MEAVDVLFVAFTLWIVGVATFGMVVFGNDILRCLRSISRAEEPRPKPEPVESTPSFRPTPKVGARELVLN